MSNGEGILSIFQLGTFTFLASVLIITLLAYLLFRLIFDLLVWFKERKYVLVTVYEDEEYYVKTKYKFHGRYEFVTLLPCVVDEENKIVNYTDSKYRIVSYSDINNYSNLRNYGLQFQKKLDVAAQAQVLSDTKAKAASEGR